MRTISVFVGRFGTELRNAATGKKKIRKIFYFASRRIFVSVGGTREVHNLRPDAVTKTPIWVHGKKRLIRGGKVGLHAHRATHY
jgi:hypothetical protein